MKFLLVAPRHVTHAGQYYEFPLGLAYISSSLKAKGFDVLCVNLNHVNKSIEETLQSIILKRKVDVVCTGGLSADFSRVNQIVKIAHNTKKEITTIVGGGLVSCEPEISYGAVNPTFGVLFEGEETIVELAEALETGRTDFSSVRGIIYYENGKKIITDKRQPIKNLDAIPYPDFEGFEGDFYLDLQMTNDNHFFYPYDKPRVLPMVTSRSCPFSCSFCFHPLGDQYRQRSLENIFGEFDWLVSRFRINMVMIYDELFAANRKRIEEFCRRIKRYNLKWIAQLRVGKHIDNNLLRMMKEAGCCTIGYGLESASNTILKSMGKHTTKEEIENALQLTRANQIGLTGNFIFGDAEETVETANETLRWWKEHPEYQIRLTPIYVYPGTKLYIDAVEKGIIKNPASHLQIRYPIINVSKMHETEFQDLLKNLIRYNQRNRETYSAKVLQCVRQGKSRQKGSIYSVTVECPHCHKSNTFSQFNIDLTRQKESEGSETACRHCNQRFVIFVPTWILKLLKLFPEIHRHQISQRLLRARQLVDDPRQIPRALFGRLGGG